MSFHSHVSLDPHRYLVCLARPNHTFLVAEGAQHLAIHLLDRSNHELAAAFGSLTGQRVDKFEAWPWRPWEDGTPLLEGVPGWMVGAIIDRHELGDHVGFVLDVVDADRTPTMGELTLCDLGAAPPGHPL